MTDDERPNPDTLLRRVVAEETRAKRAKLKVFFGFAPGVGKTYRMLEVAQAARAKGEDVVIGVLETHGRSETAALSAGLEVIPRRRVVYRGRTLEELDLDAILARKPALVLIDELAHSNAAGSRHSKRWRDVQEILDAGIDVLSTLNVQHVESLNDVVAQITHQYVRETVPDSILDRADTLELVDLSPEELLTRLQEGKVYLPAQAARATQHFFKTGNLLALRELALRRTAERVDADVSAYRTEHGVERTWAAGERILVCVSAAPASARLVRAARRMAAGLRAPWVAAYVDSSDRGALRERDRKRLEAHLRLAQSLGATVARLTGVRASDAVLDYARKHNVTRLILGKPTHSRLRDVLRGSMLDDVVRGSGDIDVHIISGDGAAIAPEPPEAALATSAFAPMPYLGALACMAAVTAVALGLDRLLGIPDVEMLYLLGVMVVAMTLGRGPSMASAGFAVLAFDFFFVPPQLTFAVADIRYVLTFGMMFGVGIILSTLVAKLRRQERNALSREARTAALLALSRALSSAEEERSVLGAANGHATGVFVGGVRVVGSRADLGAEDALASWVLQNGRAAGLGTDTLPGNASIGVPIRLGSEVLGAIVLTPEAGEPLRAEDRDFWDMFASQIAFVLSRVRLAAQAKQSMLRMKTEELRSSLLSLVSHDLRTPLAVITGAATALRDDASLPALTTKELLETICDEAERLERLVTNLLDMTRLQGGVALRKEWLPPIEVVGAALTKLERRLGQRKVEVAIADQLPLIEMDPVLGEQLLVNLLENAIKHSPESEAITVGARAFDDTVELTVADHGAGIATGDEERIFERFYQSKPSASSDGFGLGLAICRAIADAHGATLTAENRAGGGALFRLRVPAGQPPSSAIPMSVMEESA